MKKPRLRPHSYAMMLELGKYIRQHQLQAQQLLTAASDVFDGQFSRQELDELIRKKWLRLQGKPKSADDICGQDNRWTVTLTAKAVDLCWPHGK